MKLPSARKWLIGGGGGHEGGEDGLRAGSWSGEAVIELLEAYRQSIEPIIVAAKKAAVWQLKQDIAFELYNNCKGCEQVKYILNKYE